MEEYTKSAVNTVNRLKNRGACCEYRACYAKYLQFSTHCIKASYDHATIHQLVNSTPVLHVSFVPDPTNPLPTILPMIGVMGLFPDDPEAAADDAAASCYLHGYVSSRMMKLAADAGEAGLPVCVAATQFDGIVLALTPNSHSYNYRSAVLFGHAAVLAPGSPESLWAMELITENVLPGRWDNSRVPPDGAEIASTRVLKVRVDSASAKTREGGPKDERKDLRREDVLERVWTGVVPVWQKIGQPVPGSYNRLEKVPGYIEEFVEGWNQRAESYTTETAQKTQPAKKQKREE